MRIGLIVRKSLAPRQRVYRDGSLRGRRQVYDPALRPQPSGKPARQHIWREGVDREARIKPLVRTRIGHGENPGVVDQHVKLRLFTQDLVDQPSCRSHG